MENIFDQYANEYDLWFVENEELYKAELDAVGSLMDKDKTYIEVGVGTGLFASKLGITEGIDPSDEMSNIAKKRGIKVQNALAENLPYNTKGLDGIIMITVDCFVKDIMPVFNEAYRVLKDNGSYVMAFLNRESPLGAEYEASKKTNVYYRDATFRSFNEMKDLLSKAGLKIVNVKQTVYKLENTKQPVKDGYGEGVFTVIKAVKEI